ncbi:LOW QUALITY PROTEIN: uncharacterized protein LOC126785340 [Argentina anserina]|uniref:LOW QUALITY PROTEIN: uncharacterized protein LOC126785340 n=1 Tax=Argentina anserina TaxID=57926 RepID=UPI00217689D4|nr:LOW QUALITY PROTEIN: uncharacterized protein LOC126785340 [Potentilla anserina]
MLCRNQGFAVAASHFGRRLISSSRISPGRDDSAVSYLISSCGLSPEAAIKASNKVKLKSFEKPDSVLALLREYEFSDTQILTLVRRHPQVILADAQKTLLPKLEFFCSIGISRLDLAKTLVYNPLLLSRSLRNHFVPAYTFLKKVVISDLKVVSIPYEVRILMKGPEFFSQLVVEVHQLGFDPQLWSHCLEKRRHGNDVKAYRSWGWSDDDIRSALRLWPLCMTKSEKKIMATMDFLVNKMGLQSGNIAECPYIFRYSLEKRIIPRCSVVKVLLLRGLIEEKKLSLSTLSTTSEKYFLNRFVTRYLDEVPQLSDMYQGKVDIWKPARF